MTKLEFWEQVSWLRIAAEINHLYHQHMQWWYSTADQALRIAIGVLAAAALVFAIPHNPIDMPWAEFWVAVAALLVAFALNIAPVAEWSNWHRELSEKWNALESRAAREVRRYSTDCVEPVAGEKCELLDRLYAEFARLNGRETAAWGRLLRRCQREVQRRVNEEAATRTSSAAASSEDSATESPPAGDNSASRAPL